MARGIFVGIGGIPRRVKPYIGVNGTPRKVKKAYVGIGGSARLVYSTEIEYQGTLTPLQEARYRLQGWANSKYALFMGGASASTNYSKVDAYDSNFVKFTPAGVFDSDKGVNYNVGGSFDNYAFYAPCGTSDTSLTAYDTKITRSTVPWAKWAGPDDSDSINTANYVYIALGTSSFTKYVSRKVDSNLVVSSNTSLPNGDRTSRGLSIGSDYNNYAVIAGGTNSGITSANKKAGALHVSTGVAYGSIDDLVLGRYNGKGTGNSSYSLIVGGYYINSDGSYPTNVVDAYSTNLVHSVTYLTGYVGRPAVVYTTDFAYVVYQGLYNSIDKQLVVSTFTPSSSTRYEGALINFQNDRILYGGGINIDRTRSDEVSLYRF